jgi:hypothetical protein
MLANGKNGPQMKYDILFIMILRLLYMLYELCWTLCQLSNCNDQIHEGSHQDYLDVMIQNS